MCVNWTNIISAKIKEYKLQLGFKQNNIRNIENRFKTDCFLAYKHSIDSRWAMYQYDIEKPIRHTFGMIEIHSENKCREQLTGATSFVCAIFFSSLFSRSHENYILMQLIWIYANWSTFFGFFCVRHTNECAWKIPSFNMQQKHTAEYESKCNIVVVRNA